MFLKDLSGCHEKRREGGRVEADQCEAVAGMQVRETVGLRQRLLR